MSHYDCKNCGTYGGIAFGICSDCTTKEYIEVQNKMHNIITKARLKAESKSEKVYNKVYNKYLNNSEYYNLRDELEIIERENT